MSCSGTMQTARTNGQGKFQFALEPGVVALEKDSSSLTIPSIGEVEYFPYMNVSTRYGFTDRFDLGLRLGIFNYELQSKVMITDPKNLDTVAVSVAPSVIVLADASIVLLPVRVLVGIPIGSDEIVITPQVTPSINNNDSGGLELSAGGSLGYAFKFDDLIVLPEVRVELPITNFAPDATVNVGVGLLFDSK